LVFLSNKQVSPHLPHFPLAGKQEYNLFCVTVIIVVGFD